VKLLHQKGTGHAQEGTNRCPPPPAPSPNTFSITTDGTDSGPALVAGQLDPEEYHRAKRELRKAVLELYR
jgi:hypothetical protein